jgi:hypothetical protein
VRVNQVGYPRAADKRAYPMAGASAAGSPYTVIDGRGRTVASGRVGPDLGGWSRRFPHVYPIDLTRIRRPGTFRLAVAGPAPGAAMVTIRTGVYPHCMQYPVANIAGSLDGRAPVLAGAAVEGPNSEATTGRLPHMRACPAGGGDQFARFNSAAVYRDNVESYSTVEPAIDLAATSPLAFALAAAGRF